MFYVQYMIGFGDFPCYFLFGCKNELRAWCCAGCNASIALGLLAAGAMAPEATSAALTVTGGAGARTLMFDKKADEDTGDDGSGSGAPKVLYWCYILQHLQQIVGC